MSTGSASPTSRTTGSTRPHRFVELTPPGSPCSNVLTAGYVDSKPGLSQGVQLNVEDVDAVQASLRAPAVEVCDV